MKRQFIDFMCCPTCRAEVRLTECCHSNENVETGNVICTRCSTSYPIIDNIPRFVPGENFANTFGFQWKRFSKTQLDSHSGHPISRERFFRTTGWKPEEMKDKWVLDAGCGAGRFTEVALSTGANVVALDCSSAVDACWGNFGPDFNLDVVQGDIYHMPFKSKSFDFVYCLGVLQHTPNVQEAFMALPNYLREGGKLVIDIYPRVFLNLLWPKYWLRPITKRIPQQTLLAMVEKTVRYLLPISLILGRIPLLGPKLRYVIPVANYENIFPLSKAQLKEWAILDTFDMLAPIYDQPQSLQSLTDWFIRAGLYHIEIFRIGALVGRGVKGPIAQHVN